jgi:hypothetical protein
LFGSVTGTDSNLLSIGANKVLQRFINDRMVLFGLLI